MVYQPGEGKSGERLSQLRRQYLEKYAEKEGDVGSQIIVAAYHCVEVLTVLSQILDANDRYRDLINARAVLFRQGCDHADNFANSLINATFSLYNSLNTLSHQLSEGNAEADALIRGVDERVQKNVAPAGAAARTAAALNACFPLLTLIALAMDHHQEMAPEIQSVEQRFASGAQAAASDWENSVNALYRIVEMMQILALVTDPDFRDQIDGIATRFKEEDQSRELSHKLRNGFCRLFELSHLLTTQVDSMI